MQHKFKVSGNDTIVRFDEVDEIKRVDYRAIVDGEEYLYQLQCRKALVERIATRIHYHAKNSGEYVKFVLP